MNDCFEVLRQPRRPWLEPEALKQIFLELSAQSHPDRVHERGEGERHDAQERYTELNTAYQRLREPKQRLEHLLELERGAPPPQIQRIPSELMELAMQIGQLCRDTDSFLAEKAEVNSPLLQVQLFARGQEWAEKLNGLLKQIEDRQEHLRHELKMVDAAWETAAHGPERGVVLGRIDGLYRLFGYFNRWSAQVRERLTQLAF